MRLPSLLTMAALPGLLMLSMNHVDAFSMPTRRADMKMVGSLPNPFGEKAPPEPTPPTNPVFVSTDPADWDELDLDTPDGLIARAKIALASDLGIQNGNLLAENFICIGPFLDKPLNKVDYLAAGRFFDLRSTFPDLDYRAHDYRVDRVDPFTIRLTARTVGTMRGELRLRDQALPPNGQQMRCPPEAISITFDPTSGKIAKLCTGFAMDRLVGNTNGLCGVMAAATVAGDPPSDWEIYPALTVAQRFFGRPVAQIGESTSFLAPFPETVMVQLAKGILSSNMASEDASLLAKDFSFMTPTKGPIAKKKFLEEYAEEEFAGVEPELSHFRVDPYDPNRVWVDVRPLAAGYEGPPQTMSFTFDDDGFCQRITSSAVMDPSLGNAGGLGGPEGFRYALGEASLGIATRPIPRAVGRAGKSLLSPITGSGADDYNVNDISLPMPRGAKPEDESPVETLSTIKAGKVSEAAPDSKAPTPEKPKPSPSKPTTSKAPTFSVPKIPSLSLEQPAAAKKPAPKKPAPKAAAVKKPAPKKPAPKKPAPKPAAVKKPAPKKPAPKPAVAKKPAPKRSAPKKEAVAKTPSFSIPKIPSLSLSSPASPKPTAKKPVPKKPAPKRTAKKQEPGKVAAPTFSLPKIPTLSLSTPSASSDDTGTDTRRQEAEAKQVEAQRRADAKARQQRQEQQQAEKLKQAELKKKQEEEKMAAQLRQQQKAAEAKRESEERRKSEAEEKRAALAEARRQQEEAKKAEAEEKRAAQAEARRKQEEAKTAAAEQSRIEAEEKRAAQAEARRQAEEARKAELERKKQEAEEKRAAQVEARRQQEEAKNAALERQRAEAQKKKAATAAASTAEKAKPGASISLFGLEFGGGPAPAPKAEKAKAPAPKPRPTLNLFGGGSPAPAPAPKAKAPPSKPRPTLNLFGGGQPPSESPQQKKAVEAVKKAKPGATITLFGLGGGGSTEDSKPAATAKQQRAAKAADAAKKAKPGATINLFGLLGGGETKPAPKPAPSKSKRASDAAKTVAKARPGATINLFGLGGGAPAKAAPKTKAVPVKKAAAKPKPVKKVAPKPAPKPVAKAKATAPRGVPTLSGWRKNGDGSITGLIKGSPNFRNGEKVTTSPISQGAISAGSVVRTASGSRYFLS